MVTTPTLISLSFSPSRAANLLQTWQAPAILPPLRLYWRQLASAPHPLPIWHPNQRTLSASARARDPPSPPAENNYHSLPTALLPPPAVNTKQRTRLMLGGTAHSTPSAITFGVHERMGAIDCPTRKREAVNHHQRTPASSQTPKYSKEREIQKENQALFAVRGSTPSDTTPC
ncbi:unnamed protein product, partial [Ectocarpus sp. 13 AM-2016]